MIMAIPWITNSFGEGKVVKARYGLSLFKMVMTTLLITEGFEGSKAIIARYGLSL